MNGWEIDDYLSSSMFSQVVVSEGIKNEPTCTLNLKGLFLVKPYYLHLTRKEEVVERFLWKLVWKVMATPRMIFFFEKQFWKHSYFG